MTTSTFSRQLKNGPTSTLSAALSHLTTQWQEAEKHFAETTAPEQQKVGFLVIHQPTKNIFLSINGTIYRLLDPTDDHLSNSTYQVSDQSTNHLLRVVADDQLSDIQEQRLKDLGLLKDYLRDQSSRKKYLVWPYNPDIPYEKSSIQIAAILILNKHGIAFNNEFIENSTLCSALIILEYVNNQAQTQIDIKNAFFNLKDNKDLCEALIILDKKNVPITQEIFQVLLERTQSRAEITAPKYSPVVLTALEMLAQESRKFSYLRPIIGRCIGELITTLDSQVINFLWQQSQLEKILQDNYDRGRTSVCKFISNMNNSSVFFEAVKDVFQQEEKITFDLILQMNSNFSNLSEIFDSLKDFSDHVENNSNENTDKSQEFQTIINGKIKLYLKGQKNAFAEIKSETQGCIDAFKNQGHRTLLRLALSIISKICGKLVSKVTSTNLSDWQNKNRFLFFKIAPESKILADEVLNRTQALQKSQSI